MGSVSIPTWVVYAGMAASAVGAGASAYESHEAGVAAANADKRKARVAQDQAAQQQINTRQNMLRTLATQNALAGANGGSLNKANTMRQITQNQNDLMITSANSSAEVSLLDQAGRDSIAAGNIGAIGDIAGGVSSMASNWPKSGGGSPSGGGQTEAGAGGGAGT